MIKKRRARGQFRQFELSSEKQTYGSCDVTERLFVLASHRSLLLAIAQYSLLVDLYMW